MTNLPKSQAPGCGWWSIYFRPLGPFNPFSRAKKLASLDVGVQRMNVWGHQLSQTHGFSIHNQLHREVFPINQDLGTSRISKKVACQNWIRLMGSYWLPTLSDTLTVQLSWSLSPKKKASRWLRSLFLTQALARWSRKSLRNIKKLNPCRLCSPSNLASEDRHAVWMEDTARACALNGYPMATPNLDR